MNFKRALNKTQNSESTKRDQNLKMIYHANAQLIKKQAIIDRLTKTLTLIQDHCSDRLMSIEAREALEEIKD